MFDPLEHFRGLLMTMLDYTRHSFITYPLIWFSSPVTPFMDLLPTTHPHHSSLDSPIHHSFFWRGEDIGPPWTKF